jgi:hypothetical protein
MIAAPLFWLVFWACPPDAEACVGRYWPEPFATMRECARAGTAMQQAEREPFACRTVVPEGARRMPGRVEQGRWT